MKKRYMVTEVIEYIIAADSEEEAEELFVQSGEPYNDYGVSIEERTIVLIED